MRKFTFFASVLLAGAVAVLTSAPTRAATDTFTYEKLTYMSFGAPVQIPWATLAPGTYRFRLANPDTSRNVVQVLSSDGAIVYSMFHTIPDIRATATDESVVTFRETPEGTPPAIHSLFYGGERRGYEFIYPKATLHTMMSRQPEVTYLPMAPQTADVTEEWTEAAPIEEPELLAEVTPPVADEPAPVAIPKPTELPATASPLPLVGLGGLTSLVLGLGAGWARRRLF